MDIGCFIPRLSPHVLQAMEPKKIRVRQRYVDEDAIRLM